MKNRKKTIVISLVLCVLVVGALLLRADFKMHSRQIFAMDTYCTLEIKGGGEKVLDELEKIITDYDEKYNAYGDNSAVFSLNKNGKSSDKEIVELSEKLLEYTKKTDGAYDFSLKKLSDLWGFSKKSVTEPKNIDFSSFGADKVEINGNELVLNGVEVDFGGVMKGYVTDKLCEKLKETNITDAILNLGGNVLSVGEHKIGIQDPKDKNEIMCSVSVCNKAVVTSGVYQRTFPDNNGVMRHHILNPETGYPAESGVVSVTVVGNTATECDVLSTAFLVLGKEKTKEIMRNFDVEIIMLTDDGRLYCTEGIKVSTETFGDYVMEVL